jgi:hypothetical protein
MTRIEKLLKYAQPLGLIIFCWLTMRTVSSFSDESMTSYGFPFSWYAADSISSMAYVIAIGPLVIDLVFYVLLTYLAISLLLPQSVLPSNTSRLPPAVLWLMACASLAYIFAAISIDPHFVVWKVDGYYGENAQRSYGIQFGPGK